MKKIYWIEDNMDRALEIMYGTSCRLWGGASEEGVASTFLFFGDEYKNIREEPGLSEQDMKLFAEKVKRLLVKHCRNEEKWRYTGELFESKKELIQNPAKLIDISDNGENSSIVEEWCKESSLANYMECAKTNTSIPETMMIDAILKEMSIEDGAIVAIDLVLLFGDIDRVYSNFPIISMELYRKIRERGYNCFLYSSYTYDYIFAKNYQKTYKELYEEVVSITREKDLVGKVQLGKENDSLIQVIKKGE